VTTSLTERERLERLQKYLELWQQLLARPPRSGKVSDEEREQKLIDKMIPIAAPEISGAFHEDFTARVFCDLFSIDDAAAGEEQVLAVIPKGLKYAGRTFAENCDKPVGEHIKSCIAAELASLRDKRIVETQKKSPEELLSVVLGWPRLNAAVLLEHLTFEQRSGLLELLFAHTELMEIRLEDEPEDELLWRLWYTAVLQVIDPAVRDLLEGIERPIIVLLGEEWGKPIPAEKNPAGPLHAKYFHLLHRELSKDGNAVKDPTSVSRVARLTGVKSRSTIDRYLASGAEVALTKDGRDVHVRFTPDDILRSIEAVRGKKRGPKTAT
jgi:hypothetical protein